MRDWVKYILTASWIGLCAGLIGAVTYKLFFQPDPAFLGAGLGAFMGAFFAFVFLKMAEFLTRLRKRRLEHYNALGAIERMFNEHLAAISDNTFVLDPFCTAIREGMVSAFNFKPLHKDKSLYHRIHNLEILNKLFYFDDGVRKLNNDLETTGKLYEQLRIGLMEGHLKPEAYKANTDFVATQMKNIIGKHSDQLKEEAIELLALSHLRMKTDMPLSTWYSRFFLPDLHSKMDAKQVQEEIERVLEERQSPQVNNND